MGPCDAGITPQDRLTAAGERAAGEAYALWTTVITDPPHGATGQAVQFSLSRIDEMIRGEQTKLKRAVTGLGWTWRAPYRGDGDYQWCGAFAARCWEAAGLLLAHRRHWWSSTYRLDRWASYQPLEISAHDPPNQAPTAGEPQRLYQRCDGHSTPGSLLWQPRAGDVALLGRSGYGTHVAVVESYEDANRLIRTISGNAWGELPGGRRAQGVVRRAYPIGTARPDQVSHVRRILRPALTDLA